jgi:ABC-type multidrug transport system ATPase subunit
MSSLPINTAAGCLNGYPGVLLPPIIDSNGNRSCLPGFFCPHLDAANASTYPTLCAPTLICGVKRLQGAPCSPQSPFEPQLCNEGHYCPDCRTMVRCPKGHYCPAGREAPVKCGALAICGEAGIRRPRDGAGMVGVVCIAAVFLLAYKMYYRFWRCVSLESPGGFENEGDVNHTGYIDGTVSPPSSPVEVLGVGVAAAVLSTSGRRDNRLHDAFVRARGGRPPQSITFEGLTVTIPGATAADDKVVLRNATGAIRSGRVTAVMGPSGCGKTVLISAIMGKLDPSWRVDGAVSGIDRSASASVGFVPQDDVLFTELTVHANVYYASELRLPSSWDPARRATFRNDVLASLGLWDHINTTIGDDVERGASGGQRKRVSIAMELAAAPLVVVLDEPTSGLDGTTSLELVLLLRDIAASADIPIALVVHQPRVEIWDCLDDLYVLAGAGWTAYHGPRRLAAAFFAEAGVFFPADSNPADVLIDNVSQQPAVWDVDGDVGPAAAASSPRRQSLQPFVPLSPAVLRMAWGNLLNARQAAMERAAVPGGHVTVVPVEGDETDSAVADAEPEPLEVIAADIAYINDQLQQKTPQREPMGLDKSDGGGGGSASAAPARFEQPNAPPARQFALFFLRSLECQLSTPRHLVIEAVVITLCGAILGNGQQRFEHSGTYREPFNYVSPFPNLKIVAQLHMYQIMSLSFAASVAGVGIFGRHRPQYFREAAAGVSRPAFFAATIASVFPRVVFAALIFAACLTLIGQLFIPAGVVFGCFLAVYWCTYGIAAAVSMVLGWRDAPIAALTITMSLSTFTGFIPFPLWMKRLTFGFWAAQTMQEEHARTIDMHSTLGMGKAGQGYERDQAAIAWPVMFCMGVVIHALAFTLMVQTQRHRQR